jgi:hypothetical protein
MDASRAETGDPLGAVEAGGAEAAEAAGAVDGAAAEGTGVAAPLHAAKRIAAAATNPPRRFRI